MEVNVAILILAVGLVGVLAGFPLGYQILQDSRNVTQAMVDAGFVLDQIRSKVEERDTTGGFNTGFNEVRTWTESEWSQWIAGLNLPLQNLRGESIRVVPGTAAAGLLPLSVQVRWQAGSRLRRISTEIMLTNRGP